MTEMDKVMIGALADMHHAGLYENAEKIILCLAGFISAIGTVMLPKISHMTARGLLDEVKKHIDASMELVMCMVSITPKHCRARQVSESSHYDILN